MARPREDRIKVITGKIGPDDHYRGIIVVTQAFRDAGMEVVYLGIGQSIEGVLRAVVEEDAEVVGLSFLCGGHKEIMKRFMERVREEELDDVLVVMGGLIPEDDIPALNEMGVAKVFLSETPLKEIVEFVEGAKSKAL